MNKKRRGKAINLLMLENGEAYHYVLMKNLNRLLRSCADGNNTKEICPYCCHGFDKQTTNDEKMEEHMAECFTNGGTKVKMPEVGENTIEFNQYYQQQVAPYCIYADFESVLKKDSEKKTIHEISGYSLCVKSPYEDDQIYHHRGDDAGKLFIAHIQSLGKELRRKIGNANAYMIYGKKEKEIFEKATTCHSFEGDLKKSNKIGHFGKINQWLKRMRLPNIYPSESDVKEKLYSSNMKISEQNSKKLKQNSVNT